MAVGAARAGVNRATFGDFAKVEAEGTGWSFTDCGGTSNRGVAVGVAGSECWRTGGGDLALIAADEGGGSSDTSGRPRVSPLPTSVYAATVASGLPRLPSVGILRYHRPGEQT